MLADYSTFLFLNCNWLLWNNTLLNWIELCKMDCLEKKLLVVAAFCSNLFKKSGKREEKKMWISSNKGVWCKEIVLSNWARRPTFAPQKASQKLDIGRERFGILNRPQVWVKLGRITWQGVTIQKITGKSGDIWGRIPCQIVVRYWSIR